MEKKEMDDINARLKKVGIADEERAEESVSRMSEDDWRSFIEKLQKKI